MELRTDPETQKRIWERVTYTEGRSPVPEQPGPSRVLPAMLWGTAALVRHIPGGEACLAALRQDCAAVSARWYLRYGTVPVCERVSRPDTPGALYRLCVLRRQEEIALIRSADYLPENLKERLVCHGKAHIRLFTWRLEQCFRAYPS